MSDTPCDIHVARVSMGAMSDSSTGERIEEPPVYKLDVSFRLASPPEELQELELQIRLLGEPAPDTIEPIGEPYTDDIEFPILLEHSTERAFRFMVPRRLMGRGKAQGCVLATVGGSVLRSPEFDMHL